jgi:hypothetical protein
MLFVLAVMYLLMAVTTSVLVSAYAGHSAGMNKQIRDQLNLYADSIQRSVLYSLRDSRDYGEERVIIGNPAALNSLGEQLLAVMYDLGMTDDENNDTEKEKTINLSAELGGYELPYVEGIKIKIALSGFYIGEHREPDPLFGYERTPASIAINGTAAVTVRVKHETGGKAVASVVEYDFAGGLLLDTGEPYQEGPVEEFKIGSAGAWSVK